MKTHRAAFEGAFFATATLWMSLQRDRAEYAAITMKAKSSLRVLGLSLERFEAVCSGSDFRELMLKGVDELQMMAMETEARYDGVHADCFRLGMHCGNLLGVVTFGSKIPGSDSAIPAYTRNIANAEARIPLTLPPVTRMRTLASVDMSFSVLTSSVEQVAELLERYAPESHDVISILFLAADPTDASRLRLGEEFREVSEQLGLAELRDQFKLELPRLSLRPRDISAALLNTRPRIVHFSGHGTREGALYFENEAGKAQPVPLGALAALFEQFSDQIDCVVLNACFSEVQGREISQHIKYVIGMNQEIGDKAAIAFAVGFYQALGAGRAIDEAYRLGCVQIRLRGIPEHLTPVLLE
jgi:hypothetical protein